MAIHDNEDEQKLHGDHAGPERHRGPQEAGILAGFTAASQDRPPEQADPVPAGHPAAPDQEHLGILRDRQRSPGHHDLLEPGHELPVQRQPDQPGHEGKAPRGPAGTAGQRHRARELQDRLRREDGLAGAEPGHHGPDPGQERAIPPIRAPRRYTSPTRSSPDSSRFIDPGRGRGLRLEVPAWTPSRTSRACTGWA
ncbi:MAG: hypothetical protein MZV70_35040 [Desulfobacterales bacterium]|nr:hypothetical protein [Desulfobacterales bacterium]